MAKPKFPWMHLRKKADPEIPYKPPLLLDGLCNGEFYTDQSDWDRKVQREILRRADDNARRLGLERREFMASAMGMCTSLAVLNVAAGCGDENGTVGGATFPDGTTDSAGGSGGTGAGGEGGFQVTEESMMNEQVAEEMVGGDEFILDLQTHHIEDRAQWQSRHTGNYSGDGFANAVTFFACDMMPKSECIDFDQYVDQVFMQSDTSVAVLSGFPSNICDDDVMCRSLIDNEGMVLTRDKINEAAGSQRVVQHCQVAPNDQWDRQARMMERIRSDHGNNGWKCYPPWGPGPGWYLDGDIGQTFIQKCLDLGEPLICAHKGFPLPGFDPAHADPKDVGPAAMMFPDANFVIYHSAVDTATVEGPYDPAASGTNRLCKTVEENGLKGKNVYAELGSAWALNANHPERSQHLIGKLLKYVGEDNVVWGSECVWFGSPQVQIEAFRRFQISEEFQEMYGYPAITKEIREKIFGLNAAKLYGVDPNATRNAIDASKLAMVRRNVDGEFGGRRWAFQDINGPRSRREFINLIKWKDFKGEPG